MILGECQRKFRDALPPFTEAYAWEVTRLLQNCMDLMIGVWIKVEVGLIVLYSIRSEPEEV